MGKSRLALAIVAAIGLGIEADIAPAARYDEDEDRTWRGCQPENSALRKQTSAFEYARMIEPELGFPPAGDCPSQIVGDDYPYKSRFNQPNPKALQWTERPPFSISQS